MREDAPGTVHRLRALTVLLDQHGGAFAAQHGLGGTDVRALIALLDMERAGVDASPTRLARELRLTTASTTVLLDRLERAGHVRRTARTDDRRRVDVTVTDAAKQLGWTFFGPLITATRAVLDERTAAERAVIDRFLDDLVTALEAGPEDGPTRDHR
ncbi:MarR family transcriptional regulator [Modestobacter sp. VKM Ac-2979]|uniref:MarR family winged helix-turn-helix transcriptional regulator n=1 Tax=unclassified Modestobacter TaxID=2643866 RepID=UPI0022AB5D68|nr:MULTISPECIES: MarR family transcriptional regulator [unclassified Modestobacter]MCZ2811156.1 MarR family transcriptional regulator [Modestobacter sp. VKM Ac-2979]MCZ2840669.1 MarR family transcriptional regulator [Modestobacter sp. VKM Ac-2980]